MRPCFGLLALGLLSTTALAQQQPAQRADLCAELSAYVQQQDKQKTADTAPPPQQATAVQAPAKQPGERPQPGGTDAPQQTSGISGPVTHGGTGAPGPQGQAQESAPSGQQNPQAGGRSEAAANRPPENAPQQQGQQQQGQPPKPQQQAQANPPAAAQAPQAPPPSPEAIQAAQSAVDAKDVLACRDAAQKMRRAGVNLPAPLLALAAVDPKILKPEGGAGAGGGAGP